LPGCEGLLKEGQVAVEAAQEAELGNGLALAVGVDGVPDFGQGVEPGVELGKNGLHDADQGLGG